jgi:hypothetical protein
MPARIKGRFTMSEEDLELLITLDDPEGAPEEDTFNPLPAEKYLGALEYWLDQPQGKGTARPTRPTGKMKTEIQAPDSLHPFACS